MRWSSGKIRGADKVEIEAIKAVIQTLVAGLDAREIVNADQLPTSSRGLSTGKLWNDRGIVKIKS